MSFADDDEATSAHPERGSRPRLFAHRGASGMYPEHTRAAYMQALVEGADGLEVDVQLTACGNVVCFHDSTLERTSDGVGPVAETTLAQMRRLDVESWKMPGVPSHYGEPDEQLMSLSDVLDLLVVSGRDISLAIELKRPAAYAKPLADRVIQTLLKYGWEPDTSIISAGRYSVEVSFMSFCSASLHHLKQVVPAQKLCALFGTDSAERAETLIGRGHVGIAGPGMEYVYRHWATVRSWVLRGITLRVWTADTTAEVEMLRDLGVHEITTNYPARVLRYLNH